MSGRAYHEVWPAGTLMARLSDESRRDLLELAKPQRFRRDAVLIRQGEERHHVYLLRSKDASTLACVKITAVLRNGSESLFGLRVSGDVVGELAALHHSNRTATVTACTDLLAHSIPNDTFIGFLNTHADAWEGLCRMIADRLDWANRRRLDFAGYDVPIRLARVLLDLAERHGRLTTSGCELGVRLSQTELGKLIGAREDTVQFAMRKLRDAKLVKSSYRNVILIDVARLHTFADYL
jgi:CRP-like cAMP-binding protein